MPFGVAGWSKGLHPVILKHKVYIILVRLRQKKKEDIWLNLGTKPFLLGIVKWLVNLGYKRDANAGILGDIRVCDPDLNPSWHSLWKVRGATSCVQVIWSWRRRLYTAGILNPCLSLPWMYHLDCGNGLSAQPCFQFCRMVTFGIAAESSSVHRHFFNRPQLQKTRL